MRKIYFILIAISFMSCSKEKCNYTFSKRDYNLFYYKLNDTIVTTIINKTTEEQKKIEFVVLESVLEKIPRYGPLGSPIFCDGTYDTFKINFKSDNNNLIPDISIYVHMEVEYSQYIFNFPFVNENCSCSMMPFVSKTSKYYDDDLKYFSKIKIDEKEYEEVYLITKDSKSNIYLYYSGKTGFIKLTSSNTEILFENK